MYDLEEEKIIKKINENGYKKVLLQLPDGLKPKAKDLVPTIEKATGATILTWFGSNFGACDLPVGLQALGIDYVVAFGHNLYIKDKEGW
jgi:2-(3-amino-3-carboxypropyl)histidine synthase